MNGVLLTKTDLGQKMVKSPRNQARIWPLKLTIQISEVVIPAKSLSILKALSIYKFLTRKQLTRLEIEKA